MTDIVRDVPPKTEQAGLTKVEEWIGLMKRVYDVIDRQLGQIEQRAKSYGKIHAGTKFEPSDVRAIAALATAISRVRIINQGIDEDKASEDARRQLSEGRARQDELERRLARLAGSGEDA